MPATSRIICRGCGKAVEGAVYFGGRYPHGPAFCESCYRAARLQVARERNPNVDPEQIYFPKPRPCEVCGQEVAFGLGKRSWRSPHLCSPECVVERQNAARRVIPTEKSCEVCGEKFTPKRSDAKTCSDRCRQALRRRKRQATAARDTDTMPSQITAGAAAPADNRDNRRRDTPQ